MLSLSDHLKPWSELNIACIDFETTGPDPKTCEPVELAVVRFEGGEVVSRYSTLIEPDAAIPPEATAIHGITDEMVRERGTAASMAWADAQHLLRGAIPCAYHAPFDRTILHRIMVDALDGQAVARWLELETAAPWVPAGPPAGAPPGRPRRPPPSKPTSSGGVPASRCSRERSPRGGAGRHHRCAGRQLPGDRRRHPGTGHPLRRPLVRHPRGAEGFRSRLRSPGGRGGARAARRAGAGGCTMTARSYRSNA